MEDQAFTRSDLWKTGLLKAKIITTTRVVFAGGEGVSMVTEFQGMGLNGLFCADVLQPLDLVLLTDFTYKYQVLLHH